MSAVNVTNVTVLDNPSMFQNPFQFEISYECLVPLKDDLEWKLIYVGSAEDEKYDQVLESVLVGPVNVGNYRFVFQADPPEASKIPEEDIIGVTVLLLTCSYVGQEFLRVGYYVSNEYVDEHLREEPPAKVVINRVQRNILADKPRVTKFPIVFNATPPAIDQAPETVPTSNYPMVTDGGVAMESVPLNNIYPMVTDGEAAMESVLASNYPMVTDAEVAMENGPTSNYPMVTDGGVPMESVPVSEVAPAVELDDGARPMESSSPVVVAEMVESEVDDGLRPMESSPRRHEQWKAAVPIECS